jgi:hypothetical protein
MDQQSRARPATLQRQDAERGVISSMIYSAREIVCVCVDAIAGRYDR